MKRFLLVLSLLGFSMPALADFPLFNGLFTPVPDDISKAIVDAMFVSIDSSNSMASIIAAAFRYFNLLVLLVAVLIIIFKVIHQFFHSGDARALQQESKVEMGRVTLGFALLMPLTNGYCIAQILVYYLVSFGIGAADSAWNAGLGYLQVNNLYSNSNSMVSSSTANAQAVTQNFVQPAVQSLACLNAYNATIQSSPAFSALYSQMSFYNSGTNTYAFGTPNNAECGTITLPSGASSQINNLYLEALQAGPLVNLAQSIASSRVQQGTAYQFPDPSVGAAFASGVQTLTSALSLAQGEAQSQSSQSRLLPSSDASNPGSLLSQYGWLTAGFYYRLLVQLQSGTLGSLPYPSVTASLPTGAATQDTNASSANGDVATIIAAATNDVMAVSSASSSTSSSSGPCTPSSSMPNYASLLCQLYNATDAQFSVNKATATWSQSMTYINTLGKMSDTGDPFLAAVQLGSSWSAGASAALIGFTIAAPLSSLIANIMNEEVSAGRGVDKVVDVTEPIIFATAAMLEVQGGLLGFLFPMVPLVIFFGGVVGWLCSVIGAMAAAPIVAIGLAWPTANPTPLGRAQPGVMLLLNLLLRPSLMIAGFLIALVLVAIGFKLLNFMFTVMMYGFVSLDAAVGYLVVGFAYFSSATVVVTRCFSVIHQVPNKVLQWVGDRSQESPDAHDLFAPMKEAVEQAANTIGQLGSGGGVTAIFDNDSAQRKPGQGTSASKK